MKSIKLAVAVAVFVASGSSLYAQAWKWDQLPDFSTNGVDILATFNTGVALPTRNSVLVDNFIAGQSGSITDIHFWGEWLGAVEQNATFSLTILANNPAGTGGVGYDRPAQVLWTSILAPTSVTQAGSSLQQFWDPSTKTVLGSSSQMFKYDFVNPAAGLNLVAGTTYWFGIQAITADGRLFGVATRDMLGTPGSPPPPTTINASLYANNLNIDLNGGRLRFDQMVYPAGVDPSLVGQPIDLAFGIEGVPEPATAAVFAVGLAALLWRRKSAS